MITCFPSSDMSNFSFSSTIIDTFFIFTPHVMNNTSNRSSASEIRFSFFFFLSISFSFSEMLNFSFPMEYLSPFPHVLNFSSFLNEFILTFLEGFSSLYHLAPNNL